MISMFLNHVVVPPTIKPECLWQKKNTNRSIFHKVSITPSIMLSNKSKDSWFMTKSKDIVKFKYATKNGFNGKIFGDKIVSAHEPFFLNPISSLKLDIYAVHNEISYENNIRAYSVESIETKMMCLTCKNQFIFMPLLHSIET